MGRVKEKSGTPLSVIFLRYLGTMLGAIILCALILAGLFSVSFYYGIILPANYAEHQAEEAAGAIQAADKVTEDMVPELCEYAVLDRDGTIQYSTIPEDNMTVAKSAVTDSKASKGQYYYKAIEREDGYCILQYKMSAQYHSAFLRKYLMAPELLMIVVEVASAIVIVLLFSLRFGKRMREKMTSMLSAVDKIKEQNLDYEAEKSGVKEIDDVLSSLDEMRQALKKSLETQWKAEQEKNRQMSALAHDIKTPLTVVRGNAELLGETKLTEEQKCYTDYIAGSAIQMQSYVQTLIEVAKSEAGDAFAPGIIETDALLKEIEFQAKGLASVHQLQCSLVQEKIPPSIEADMGQVVRAVVNIVCNAAEHTLPDGKIEIRVTESDGLLIFTIEDNGSGFTEEALIHGTEQFFMDDKSRSSGNHYGIGLFEARRIAERHRGHLILENSSRLGGAKVMMSIRSL